MRRRWPGQNLCRVDADRANGGQGREAGGPVRAEGRPRRCLGAGPSPPFA